MLATQESASRSSTGSVIADLTTAVHRISTDKIAEIDLINREATYLAINALIEAARAGEAGRGFAVVANQVKDVSHRIGLLTSALSEELTAISEGMVTELNRQQGQRLGDLALNMIDVIDRNLYERSCDVRWWATDAAIVNGVTSLSAADAEYASHRMSVILDSYTVYLDIWMLDLHGDVLANGRPAAYPVAGTVNAASQPWFDAALRTRSGDHYVTANVDAVPELNGAQSAVYATAVRAGGAADGAVTGVLAVFFDWTKQAAAVLDSVRLTDEERSRTRCMIVDAKGRVIADSHAGGDESRHFELRNTGEQTAGTYRSPEGALVGYALTPGYESYEGMGWYGVIEQK
jgi:hypothetical protein